MNTGLQHWRRKLVIDYSEPYKDEIHNLLVKYGLSWTHSPGGMEFYKTGVDDTCNIAGYFTKKEYDRLVNWINRNNISEEICMMLNSPLGGRRGIGFGLGRSWQRKSADWWLAGGIPAANCIAAYQPKGAASYASSLVNLTGNATYDATEGVAPDWDAVNGWDFNGTTHYLDSHVIPTANQQMSAIIKFTNCGSGYSFGVYSNNGISEIRFYIVPDSGTQGLYGNGGYSAYQLGRPPVMTEGVAAFAGTNIYQDGIDSGIYIQEGLGNNAESFSMFIGARSNSGSPEAYCSIQVQAISIYNTPIIAAQVAAVSSEVLTI